MRFFCFVFVLGAAGAAQAQAAEFGVRYWYSEGKTTRSHNAQGLVPSLGNPTSVLTYTNLDAHALELHGRKDFAGGGFVRGYAGLGDIKHGSFDDEDFFRGQVKLSDSTSTVKGDQLTYASIDLGSELWQFRNGSAGFFIGFNYWSERLDAYGARFTVGPPLTIPDSVLVITNDVTWRSLRVGLTSTGRLNPETRLRFDLALVPYAKVRDEDSHWLRQAPNDLGPAPNIFIEGKGYGAQLEMELHHQLSSAWELGAGLRWWWLRARDGTREAVGISVPLKELESERGGLMVSLTRRW
jgi:hypothetical protein